jgi:hypothetical protein
MIPIDVIYRDVPTDTRILHIPIFQCQVLAGGCSDEYVDFIL